MVSIEQLLDAFRRPARFGSIVQRRCVDLVAEKVKDFAIALFGDQGGDLHDIVLVLARRRDDDGGLFALQPDGTT